MRNLLTTVADAEGLTITKVKAYDEHISLHLDDDLCLVLDVHQDYDCNSIEVVHGKLNPGELECNGLISEKERDKEQDELNEQQTKQRKRDDFLDHLAYHSRHLGPLTPLELHMRDCEECEPWDHKYCSDAKETRDA